MLKWNRKSSKQQVSTRWLCPFLVTNVVSSFLTPVASANVVGSDTQNFNPVTSGLDFVTVESSETLDPGFFNFGVFMNYAVNSLPYFENSPQGKTSYSDALLGLDLNLGIGILSNWDIGISLPQVVHQKVQSEGYRGQFSDIGSTDIRIGSKIRLWGTKSYGLALIGSANVNRIQNNPFVGKNPGPTYNLQLAADTTVANVALGANIGYRWRDPGEKIDETSPITPLGDQIIASAAASYLISSTDTKVIAEIIGSQPATPGEENSDRLESTAEALLGLKHDMTRSLAGHFGGGSELIHGRGSPDWRLYAGLNYAIGPTFSKPKEPAKVEIGKKLKKFVKRDPFAGPPKPKEKIVIHDILFEFDSATLVLGGADKTLKRLAEYLNRKPVFTKLVVEGHTDSIGTEAYNIDLSRRRAMTIKRWLQKRYNLPSEKIVVTGRGENFPIADNGNYQGRQLNRRVEFTIYRTK